jgi:YbbR domain-containing protein
MRWRPFRWLARNLGTALLAVALAAAVWISAVLVADPNEQGVLGPVVVEVIGLPPDLLLMGEAPSQARLTLRAPRSIWEKLNNNPALTQAWVDLTGLEPGIHTVPVQARVDASPVRYIKIEPEKFQVALEPLARRSIPVAFTIIGDPPLGYKEEQPSIEPLEVTVSGPESEVARVAQVRVALNVAGATSPVERAVLVELVDEDGLPVTGLNVTPKEVIVHQPISLLGGFKNVAVKVVTTGQVANGYRLTNISVFPPTVTLFADNPRLVDAVPGFVETEPVDLTGLSDDQEVSVGLSLPDGVTLVREPNVLVQVSVAAIEGSMRLSAPLEVIGLAPELKSLVSPETVEVIVAGPLNVLDTLTPADFRVVLDLSGLPPGIYQRPSVVERTPAQVRVQTTLPETVEVTIEALPTATFTIPLPGMPITPSLTTTPTRIP